MIDRLRLLLDRPLDPTVARAVVVFATAVLVGFLAVFVLGMSESSGPPAVGRQAVTGRPRSGRSLGAFRVEAPPPSAPGASRRHQQDPQDANGSPAARRVAKALRSHRALQHVPYRSARLSIRLVEAHGARAVLAISAPTILAARRGWQRFLRRYGDAGRAYLARFEVMEPAATGVVGGEG